MARLSLALQVDRAAMTLLLGGAAILMALGCAVAMGGILSDRP